MEAAALTPSSSFVGYYPLETTRTSAATSSSVATTTSAASAASATFAAAAAAPAAPVAAATAHGGAATNLGNTDDSTGLGQETRLEGTPRQDGVKAAMLAARMGLAIDDGKCIERGGVGVGVGGGGGGDVNIVCGARDLLAAASCSRKEKESPIKKNLPTPPLGRLRASCDLCTKVREGLQW